MIVQKRCCWIKKKKKIFCALNIVQKKKNNNTNIWTINAKNTDDDYCGWNLVGESFA